MTSKAVIVFTLHILGFVTKSKKKIWATISRRIETYVRCSWFCNVFWKGDDYESKFKKPCSTTYLTWIEKFSFKTSLNI